MWLLGDNVETSVGRGHPELVATGSTVEVVGGAWDNLGDAGSYPASGPAVYQAVDSRLSLVIPGVRRRGGVLGHWISDRRGGRAVGDVIAADAAALGWDNGGDQRIAVPLYLSPS